VHLRGIAPGQTVFYRVSYLDLGEPEVDELPGGRPLPRAADANHDVSFVWSGDTVGQATHQSRAGRHDDLRGDAQAHARLLRPQRRHDLCRRPAGAEKRLADGKVWKNIVTDGQVEVAETLADYRGVHRYNFLDDNLRRFNADVPMLAQWDDHEVINNWYWRSGSTPTRATARRASRSWRPTPSAPSANTCRCPTGLDAPMHLAQRFSFGPRLDLFRIDMRSLPRAQRREPPTSLGPASAFLGKPGRMAESGAEELEGDLEDRRAGHAAGAGSLRRFARQDGIGRVWRTGDDGAPLGRELEIADLLAFIKREHIRNVHWITADVHYAATHRYDPKRAHFADFLPFYEFVSGPSAPPAPAPASSTRPSALTSCSSTPPPPADPRSRPSEGGCHFGHVRNRRQERRHDGHPSRRRRRRPARDRPRAGLTPVRRCAPTSPLAGRA
jgi:alkaline phosphatase D